MLKGKNIVITGGTGSSYRIVGMKLAAKKKGVSFP